MKTIEELTDIGAAASLAELHKTQPTSMSLALFPNGVLWAADQPAREAFARAVRDEVLREQFLAEQKPTIEQPTADVPTWRPIAEWGGEAGVVFYKHGSGTPTWSNGRVLDATHFIAPPPETDPFEVWWERNGPVLHKGTLAGESAKNRARTIWNAALEAKP